MFIFFLVIILYPVVSYAAFETVEVRFSKSGVDNFEYAHNHLKIDVGIAPKYSYSAYVAAWLDATNTDRLCRLKFDTPAKPFKVTIASSIDKAVSLAGQRNYSNIESTYFISRADDSLRIVFYSPEKKAGSIIYKNIHIECMARPEAIEAYSTLYKFRMKLEQLVKDQESDLSMHANQFDIFFRSASEDLAKVFRTSTLEGVSEYTSRNFKKFKVFLKNQMLSIVPEAYVKEIYAAYLVQYAISLSRFPSSDLMEIGRKGNGTCWQQALILQHILKSLGEIESKVISTDNLTMGHTVVVTSRAIIDPSNNIVIQSSAGEWNRMSVEKRAEVLLSRTYYGVTLNINAKQRSPESYQLFFRETGKDLLRDNYISTVNMWPYVRLNTASR